MCGACGAQVELGNHRRNRHCPGGIWVRRILGTIVCIAAMIEGCGTRPTLPQPPKTHVTGVKNAINPALQAGGFRAATAWIRQHDHPAVKTFTLTNGDLILTKQPGWAIYVDTARKVWEQVPLPLANITFERQTNRGLLFLVQGPVGDSPDFPFPYQVLCTLQPGSDDVFVSQTGPAYFRITQGVTFGGKPNEALVSVTTISNRIQFRFGPGNSGSSFGAGGTTVPSTRITYDASKQTLVMDFTQTRVAHPNNVLYDDKAGPVRRITLTTSAEGVRANLLLAPEATYYTGTIIRNQSQMPYLLMQVTSGTPPAPWAP